MPISYGGFWKGPGPNGSDVGADAMALPETVNGHQVFGVKVHPGVGYRVDNTVGVPTGSQPEGVYMVTSSNYYNSQCCFDFGSAETDHKRRRQRDDERHRVGQRVLVRRLHRARAVGRGRPGERHVQHQHRPEQPRTTPG